MASLSTSTSASAQAAYSELLEVARQDDLSRSVQNLSGSFNRKTVKGSVYWYYQFTQGAGGGTRQIFVGKDSDKLRALVEHARARDTSQVDRLAKSAIALGCASTTPVHFRIIRRLNEIGFFHAGGVLVGAHAFLAYGNALGVSWERLARTHDLDFAHSGRDLDVALPSNLWIDTKDAIEHLEAGFLPVPGFRPWDKTASFVSKVDKTLRVDFLTPMVGGKQDVYRHPSLGVNLQPLRFLEFLLEDVQQAVVLSAAGAVLVTVPDPARFALHKLLVHVERRVRSPDKALKDLHQAAALIEVLAQFREDDVRRLWKELLERGPGWRRRARVAVKALTGVLPGQRTVLAMGKLAATMKSSVSSKNEK
jgi:hypothetical protein